MSILACAHQGSPTHSRAGRTLECAAEDLDLRTPSFIQNRDDVEAARRPSGPLALEIGLRRAEDPPLFFSRHGLGGNPEADPVASLHLDEAERFPLASRDRRSSLEVWRGCS